MAGKSKKTELEGIELHPDAWERFEDFVTTKIPTRPAAAPKPARKRAKPSSRKARAKN